MKSFLIGYDLISPGKDYQELFDEILEIGDAWHHLNSTWFIKSDLSAKEIRDRLAKHTDENDKLLILESTGDASWTSR